MGNRAAIYFQDYDRDGVEQPAIGLYMHYNGGPESIYAFTKELATYAKSQREGDREPQVSTDAMATRFIQLTTNYINNSGSDFMNVYMVAEPGSPRSNNIETEHDVYVIRPDFGIDRFDDATGRAWSKEEMLDEFRDVQAHHYWTGEDWNLKKQGLPTPQEDRHSIRDGIREANDGAFLRAYSREGVKWHERKEAMLPIETFSLTNDPTVENLERFVNSGSDLGAAKGLLHEVVRKDLTGLTGSVDYLLAHGVSIDARNAQGETALHHAQSKDMVNLLIDRGADIDARDSMGGTALHKAANVAVTSALLEHGASARAIDNMQYTPLHHEMDTDQIKVLLEHAADPNAMNYNGSTPLHYARGEEQVRLLCEHGANPNIMNNDGMTACTIAITDHLANEGDNIGVVKALLEHGFDPRVADRDGDKPADFAQTNGYGEIQKMLVSKEQELDLRDKHGVSKDSQRATRDRDLSL